METVDRVSGLPSPEAQRDEESLVVLPSEPSETVTSTQLSQIRIDPAHEHCLQVLTSASPTSGRGRARSRYLVSEPSSASFHVTGVNKHAIPTERAVSHVTALDERPSSPIWSTASGSSGTAPGSSVLDSTPLGSPTPSSTSALPSALIPGTITSPAVASVPELSATVEQAPQSSTPPHPGLRFEPMSATTYRGVPPESSSQFERFKILFPGVSSSRTHSKHYKMLSPSADPRVNNASLSASAGATSAPGEPQTVARSDNATPPVDSDASDDSTRADGQYSFTVHLEGAEAGKKAMGKGKDKAQMRTRKKNKKRPHPNKDRSLKWVSQRPVTEISDGSKGVGEASTSKVDELDRNLKWVSQRPVTEIYGSEGMGEASTSEVDELLSSDSDHRGSAVPARGRRAPNKKTSRRKRPESSVSSRGHAEEVEEDGLDVD